jgi:hypothetical protein
VGILTILEVTAKAGQRRSGLLGPGPTGTGTIAFDPKKERKDPTFGSFTLLQPVSLVKVFRLFILERIFLVLRVWRK